MKLSIITVTYNNVVGLVETLNSVVEQSWTDFEFIIIDGGSTDGSIEIIKQHQDKLAYWVSEPDHGIYHAMNKGIVRASGEYLLMLNAGDFLCDSSVLDRVFASNNFEEDILAGDVYRTVDGKIFDRSSFPDVLTFGFLRNGTISHQAAFIKRAAHDVVGLYDENLKYASDWKFFILSICKYNLTYRHLPFFIATCDTSGLTCRPENFPAMKQENAQILEQNFSAFLRDYDELEQIKRNTFNQKLSRLWPVTKSYLKKSSFLTFLFYQIVSRLSFNK